MNIRTLCLGILHFDDATGYEINKLVTDGRFSPFIEASYGSIYPALTKMMGEDLVTCREEAQDGKPSRKIYSITTDGERELFKALKDSPKPNRFKSEFLFLGLFAGLIPSNHLSDAIERHERELSSLVDDLHQHIEHCTNPGSRFALGYGIAANEATLKFLRDNKKALLLAQTNDTKPDPAEKLEKSYE